ncbi:CRISPR-associated helicase/endonuclease Cas3 [Maritimibacter sp. 55A14]|nr:CRISPR-associated helicase/endonuclease Cas3 [Maritimibacter sp. 55A14]
MLDVAAVAEHLLEAVHLPAPQYQALVFLTALHDLGKISATFRSMLRGAGRQTYRHWELTEVHLNANMSLLASILTPERDNRLPPLIGATAGHHGRPSTLDQSKLGRAALTLTTEAKADAQDTIKAFASLWPEASIAGLTSKDVMRLSWWLSGLVTTADWIGSNTDWFRAQSNQLSLADYLTQSRDTAERALVGTGIMAPLPSDRRIFNWPELRPMQNASAAVPLPDGSTLAIIEDETGAGKTEAALLLAQRMLLAGKGRGLYFALPTMATADAMFSRVSQSIGKMFDSTPSVTLAHGRAGLSEDYRDIVEGSPNAPEDISCTEWLADNRRRALLANVGVGTIDQALLAVLPVRFQTLRHFGLSSKILIVDEVHELGEGYVAETLCHLLRMHRQAGGSAILLTATLPLDLRRKLLAVYDGVDDADLAYPALTIAGGERRRDLPQDTGPKGTVRVERLTSPDAAIDLIAKKTGQGAASVWVRNAVDDAIAAVQALRAAGIRADLLHARYTLGDRKRIEKTARERFGKGSTDTAGRVLVGTQILESSLDIDFDVMVSDLAPMAGLVQRVGRLWRHMDKRPAADRPVSEPVLHVLAPDPAQVENSRWLSDTLDKGAYVYSADLMWRTACHLFDEGRIVAPSGIRSLIERSYSNTPALPEVLETFEMERLGVEASHGALASQNAVNLDEGYRAGGRANDDASYPTRLGPEERILVLARERGGGLVPLIDGADGWAMSEVSVARHKLEKLDLPDQGLPEIASVTDTWPDWKKASHVICPVSDDGKICADLRYDSDIGLVFATAD